MAIMNGKDLNVSYRLRYDDLKSLPILDRSEIKKLHTVYGVEYVLDSIEAAYENHIK